MKKIFLITILVLFSFISFSQTIVDKGEYVNIAIGSNDTISLLKINYFYTRQIGDRLYLVFSGYGERNISIPITSVEYSLSSLTQYRNEIMRMFSKDYRKTIQYSVSNNPIEVKDEFIINNDTSVMSRDTIIYDVSNNLIEKKRLE